MSASSIPSYTAFVMGGTGAVGKQVLIELSKSPLCNKVISVTRNTANVPSDSKLKQVIISDFDQLLLEQSPDTASQQIFSGESKVDVAFCCLGSTRAKAGSAEAFTKIDKIYPLKFYDLLFRNNNALQCKQFSLVTSVGSNANSWFLYPKVKGELENELMQKSQQQPNRMIIFRPSFLVAQREEHRFGEAVGLKIFKSVAWLPWINKYAPITVEDVAKAMVQEWETYYTQTYLSQQQISKESLIIENQETQQLADERNKKAQ